MLKPWFNSKELHQVYSKHNAMSMLLITITVLDLFSTAQGQYTGDEHYAV